MAQAGQEKSQASQAELKRAVARAALENIRGVLSSGAVIGVGTGSTANEFIDCLAAVKDEFDAAVASSEASAERLAGHGIRVIDANSAGPLAVYVDGADEFDPSRALIKGAGAALTREKIVAACSERFVCIVDDSKRVDALACGRYPIPVEVIPMARSLVARQLTALGGEPEWRQGVVTDNGNIILDVHGLTVTDPDAFEAHVNNLVGVVCNGIFAANRPDTVLIANPSGVQVLSG